MTALERARGRFGVSRTLLTSALVLPLSAVLMVAVASPASAEIRFPENDREFPAHTTFDITATYQLGGSQLRLTPPGGEELSDPIAQGPDSLTERTLSYTFNTSCWDGTGKPCSNDKPAPNGRWRVRQTGGTTGEAFFRLRIPARAPTAVTAVGTSARDMQVKWSHGGEPDLTGFEVREGERAVKSVAPGDCRAGICTTVISYPVDGTGAHTYSVRAFRSTGVADDQPLASPPSASASGSVLPPVVIPGPGGEPVVDGVPGTEASPAPSGSPSGSPGASGSPAPGAPDDSPGPAAGRDRGANTPATSAAARRQAFSQGFNAFGPKLGVPKLPPLPQAPAVAPLADGTFEPTLGFEDQELSEAGQPSSVAGRVTSTVGAAIVSDQLVRNTAGALVLLLAGAHLRRWLSTAPPE